MRQAFWGKVKVVCVCVRCGVDILIRDAREKRERLLVDIEVLEKEIQDTNLKKAIDKYYNILRDVLQKHQTYIKEKKMSKLRRDANDYVTGRVFTYAHKLII
ncbi:hypothetical protein NDU88_009122 [Pleurodeles waltl]|uniref:Uncharacterized protein n=1 Tax=Pleurodeles waltl TaxID=8319 RepID=A0AAV7RZJ4_PLEWA|nr:hypothetical protein NDU88_009122 [Pleurodeles waltl]